MLTRRTMILKPMQAGLSGYARLQAENGRALIQVHARGLQEGEARLFWYLSGQTAREIGSCRVNANGEVSLEAEAPQDAVAPDRLQGLVLISGGDMPRPLMIGLCVQQSAGSLMDVKNAALALCDRLKKKPEPFTKQPPAVRPVQASLPPLPREIFLPAIDPAPYTQAAAQAEEPEPVLPPPQRSAPPVDALPALRWPRGFESLKAYFEKALPVALFPLPGWRFVYAAHAGGPNGLWIGIQPQDGAVRRVAYVHRGEKPPAGGPYRPARGLDGQLYQVLWQEL